MVVLGIDPGTANTGYGVIARGGARLVALDGGVIETAPGLEPGERLAVIHGRIGELIDAYHPDALAIEDLYFGANARSAFAVGQARGVVLLAAAQAEVPVREATPNEVKVAVTGHGRAEKDQVGRMVAVCLGLAAPPHPDDTADALAVAIWAANAERPGVEHRSSVLDRASVDPMAAPGNGNGNGHGNGYERAVKEAIAREEASKRR